MRFGNNGNGNNNNNSNNHNNDTNDNNNNHRGVLKSHNNDNDNHNNHGMRGHRASRGHAGGGHNRRAGGMAHGGGAGHHHIHPVLLANVVNNGEHGDVGHGGIAINHHHNHHHHNNNNNNNTGNYNNNNNNTSQSGNLNIDSTSHKNVENMKDESGHSHCIYSNTNYQNNNKNANNNNGNNSNSNSNSVNEDASNNENINLKAVQLFATYRKDATFLPSRSLDSQISKNNQDNDNNNDTNDNDNDDGQDIEILIDTSAEVEVSASVIDRININDTNLLISWLSAGVRLNVTPHVCISFRNFSYHPSCWESLTLTLRTARKTDDSPVSFRKHLITSSSYLTTLTISGAIEIDDCQAWNKLIHIMSNHNERQYKSAVATDTVVMPSQYYQTQMIHFQNTFKFSKGVFFLRLCVFVTCFFLVVCVTILVASSRNNSSIGSDISTSDDDDEIVSKTQMTHMTNRMTNRMTNHYNVIPRNSRFINNNNGIIKTNNSLESISLIKSNQKLNTLSKNPMNINDDISKYIELPNHSKIALTKQAFEKECSQL